MFDRETNITRYQHNVLEFVFANQQRNLFFCQNEDDRQLDFLKKHPRLQFIPWSHCDQVRVPIWNLQIDSVLTMNLRTGPDFRKPSVEEVRMNRNPLSSLRPNELHFT